MELAQANVAALQAELNNITAQLPELNAPHSQEPLAPHAQAVLTVGTALLVASGLLNPEDDEDLEDDDDEPASSPAPPRPPPSPPPPPPPPGHAIMV